MKISEKKKTELYKAIHEPIMQLRIRQNAGFSIEQMDEKLYALNNEIWKEVIKTLNIDDG